MWLQCKLSDQEQRGKLHDKISILQEHLVILNTYKIKIIINNKKWKLIELQGETEKSKIIVGIFNNLLSSADITTWQEICKDKEELNNTINQHDLIDIYRTLHLKTAW